MRTDIFGYYDSASQTVPAHDPGPQGLCPVCCHPVGRHTDDNPLKAISLTVVDKRHRDRSFFFRAHALCWKRTTPHEQNMIESSVIDEHVSLNSLGPQPSA